MSQFSAHAVARELNKAWLGFSTPMSTADAPPVIATGNWGCGNFGGHHALKALLQLMAAAEAGRPLQYFSFGVDVGLAALHEWLVTHAVTVGMVYRVLQYLDSARGRSCMPDEPSLAPELEATRARLMPFLGVDVTPQDVRTELNPSASL